MKLEEFVYFIGLGIVLFIVISTVWFIIKYRPIITMLKGSGKALNWVLASFDTSNNSGASARKLSAAWAMLILATPPQMAWIIWACRHNDFSLLPTLLTIDLGYAAAALGMTTYSAIQNKKIDSNPSNINGPTDQQVDDTAKK